MNAEQVAMVKARHDGKAKLLAEMRAERAAAVLDQHSHIGVELSRLIQPAPVRLTTYLAVAGLANMLAENQQDAAGRVFASLARGIERGTHEMWGPEAAAQLRGAFAIDPQLNAVMPPAQPEPSTDEGQDHDTSLSGVAYPVSPEANAAAGFEPEAPVREIDVFDADGNEHTVFVPDDGDELDLTNDHLPQDPDDLPSALEPAASPEPDETPMARAARLRREARRGKVKKST